MDLANVVRELWRWKFLVLLAIPIAVAVGLAVAYHVTLSPFKLEDKSFSSGAASVQMLVDTEESAVAGLPRSRKYFVEPDRLETTALVRRSQTLARVIPSNAIVEKIAERLNVSPAQISATPPAEQAGSGAQTTVQQRAGSLTAAGAAYALQISDSRDSPVINIYTQAGDAESAVDLAAATVRATKQQISYWQRRDDVPRAQRVRLEQLGEVRGGTVTSTPNQTTAILAGAGTFFGLLVVILLLANLVKSLRRTRSDGGDDDRWEEPFPTRTPPPAPSEARTPPDHRDEGNGNGNGNGHGGHGSERDGESDRTLVPER